jgi:hypothetical protein
VKKEGNEYEDIPAKAIRQAALKVLGIEDASTTTVESTAGKSCCSCGSGCC